MFTAHWAARSQKHSGPRNNSEVRDVTTGRVADKRRTGGACVREAWWALRLGGLVQVGASAKKRRRGG